MKILGGRYLGSDELRRAGLEQVGDGVLVHETAQLVDLDNIRIGSNVRVDPFAILSASRGSIEIGNHVHVAAHVCIFGGAGVRLCDFVNLSQAVRIYSVSDDYSGQSMTSPMIPGKFKAEKRAPVTLGRHVIAGSGSVILPGADIGEGSALGALTLVIRPLLEWGVYSGIPAKRLKDRDRRLLEVEAEFQEYLRLHQA